MPDGVVDLKAAAAACDTEDARIAVCAERHRAIVRGKREAAKILHCSRLLIGGEHADAATRAVRRQAMLEVAIPGCLETHGVSHCATGIECAAHDVGEESGAVVAL